MQAQQHTAGHCTWGGPAVPMARCLGPMVAAGVLFDAPSLLGGPGPLPAVRVAAACRHMPNAHHALLAYRTLACLQLEHGVSIVARTQLVTCSSCSAAGQYSRCRLAAVPHAWLQAASSLCTSAISQLTLPTRHSATARQLREYQCFFKRPRRQLALLPTCPRACADLPSMPAVGRRVRCLHRPWRQLALLPASSLAFADPCYLYLQLGEGAGVLRGPGGCTHCCQQVHGEECGQGHVPPAHQVSGRCHCWSGSAGGAEPRLLLSAPNSSWGSGLAPGCLSRCKIFAGPCRLACCSKTVLLPLHLLYSSLHQRCPDAGRIPLQRGSHTPHRCHSVPSLHH